VNPLTQEIIDQLAARRAARDAEYQRHGNTLTDAGLIDMAAVTRKAPLPPIVRAAGNVVTATGKADFADKYASVGAGGTVDLGNTVIDYGTSQFILRPNVTIANGELRFTRPKGGSNSPDKNCFGMIAPSGTPGIAFNKTRIRSNNGGVWFESGVANARFDGVDVVHGTDGSYYSRLFIWAGGGAPGLTIVNGFFHDSQSSDRTLEVWGWSNGDYSFNRFDNVKDGGHIMENGGKIRMVSNLFTKLGRMGVEVQGNAVSDDFLFESNVAYGWVNPYFDCELISMCAVNMTGVKIRKSYARNDFTGNWGNTQDQGQRFGIAIEAMTADNGCTVEDNDIGGPNRWACIVAAGSKNMLVRNMRVYGAACVWGDYVSEPGTRGNGTIQDGGGNQRLTSTMPEPPNPITGGGGGGNTPVITNVKATEANPPVVTWTGGAATVTRTDQNGKTDVKPDGSPAVFPNAVSPFTDTFIPQQHYWDTWHLKYAVGDAQPVLIQLPKPAVIPPADDPIVKVETHTKTTTKAGKVQQFDSTAVVP
jgi:hypothetical protein